MFIEENETNRNCQRISYLGMALFHNKNPCLVYGKWTKDIK